MAALASRAWAWLSGLLAPAAWPIAAALAVFGIVQTVRIEGLRIWPLHITGLLAERNDAIKGRADDRAAYVSAQELARQRNEQAIAKREADYRALADQKDKEYATELADAQSAAERYIASHRLRPPAPQGGAGSATALGQDHGAGGAVGPGEAPELVGVTADDIRICTENTSRLEKAREWALGLDGVK